MAGYSEEQLRRLAHIKKHGTIANYDRSHYPEELKQRLEKERNESKNYINARKH